MLGKRRSGIEIIACILDVAMKGTTKTRIMYEANLSHDLLESYLSLLKDRGLITIDEEKSPARFLTTEKGKEFLKHYKELEKLLI